MTVREGRDSGSAVEVLEARVRELEEELGRKARPAGKARRAKRAELRRAPSEPERRSSNRAPTSVLAPGHLATTHKGSLYDATLRALATVGQLSVQPAYFAEFLNDHTPGGARRLLDHIGVFLEELRQALAADEAFREHRDRRTRLLRNRAAQGCQKSAAILANREICDGHGRWQGDLEEALAILCGGRTLRQYRRGKNVGILRSARVMFDRAWRGDRQVLYLYPARYHAAFKRARALVGE